MKQALNALSRSRRRRKGATAVEFALVAPIFFVMTFTCFEFARVCMMKSLAQDAAYEAARYAMVEGSTAQDAIDKANEVLQRLGTQNAVVIVNDGTELDDDTANVSVQVFIPMADNTFLLSYFSGDYMIATEITLIAERYKGFYDGGG